jgi:hypothetical protein
MMVMAKSTMGGTITQNCVQNGIINPPLEVRAIIARRVRPGNKKVVASASLVMPRGEYDRKYR